MWQELRQFPDSQLLLLLLESATNCLACGACSCQIGFSALVPSVDISLCCQSILTMKAQRKRNGHQKRGQGVIWPNPNPVLIESSLVMGINEDGTF